MMDCPVTTHGDYINSQVTGFPTDEDDNDQRVGGLASMSVTNGVRYHAPQSAMQDLQYVIFLWFFSFRCRSFNLDYLCTPLGPPSTEQRHPSPGRCASSGSGQLRL